MCTSENKTTVQRMDRSIDSKYSAFPPFQLFLLPCSLPRSQVHVFYSVKYTEWCTWFSGLPRPNCIAVIYSVVHIRACSFYLGVVSPAWTCHTHSPASLLTDIWLFSVWSYGRKLIWAWALFSPHLTDEETEAGVDQIAQGHKAGKSRALCRPGNQKPRALRAPSLLSVEGSFEHKQRERKEHPVQVHPPVSVIMNPWLLSFHPSSHVQNLFLLGYFKASPRHNVISQICQLVPIPYLNMETNLLWKFETWAQVETVS